MTRKLLFLVCFILISLTNYAQVNILWQTRYSGSGSNPDRAEDLVVDSKGSVYVTGTGKGVSGNLDYITIKYDSTGTQIWKMEYNGTGNGIDGAHAIAVDTGFVYVTGWSYGGVSSGYDYATIKYNKHTGATVWASASRYTGSFSGGTDEAFDIALDNLGNIYVTGVSDSSPINTKSNSAATTIKYNAAGAQQWAARYEGPGAGLDAAYSLIVEPVAGTVYVAGSVDVLSSSSLTNINYLILKYNTAGTAQWNRNYDGPGVKFDEARSIAVDAAGSVYVTGYSQNAVVTNADIATLKYNSVGTQQWVQRYNGTGNDFDKGNAIKLDAVGNIYITGRSIGVSPAAEDIIILKYNNGGTQKWTARYNNGAYDEGKALTLDNKGNVYVTGYSYMGNNKNNYTTLKYDSVGVQQWATHYNGTGNDADQAAAIAVDNGGNVFITGLSKGAGSNEDFETIKYCQLKVDAGLDTAICIGESVQLNASAVGGLTYTWTPNNGTLTNTTISNPIATPTLTTPYIVTTTNASGCVDVDTIVVTVSQYPITVITPNGSASICIGDSVTLTADSTLTYQWSTSVNDTLQSITVNTSGTYSVTLTNSTGCTSTGTITVTVNVPNINAGPDDTVCLNSSINLLATGGATYMWHPGTSLNDSTIANPVASPVVNTTYTVSATDVNGCFDSDSLTITVITILPAIPLITQTGIYTLACSGTYLTYQWYLNGLLIPGATNQVYIYNQNGNYTIAVTDSVGGCSSFSAIISVSDYIGIEEIGNVALLSVYPNPASTNVFVDLEILKASDVQIIFSSITGQQIFKENTKQQIGNYKKNLSIDQQPSGIYYLQILVDDKMVTKKIVKQ